MNHRPARLRQRLDRLPQCLPLLHGEPACLGIMLEIWNVGEGNGKKDHLARALNSLALRVKPHALSARSCDQPFQEPFLIPQAAEVLHPNQTGRLEDVSGVR